MDHDSAARPWINQRLVLEGSMVRLEPLTREHLQPLIIAGSDPAVWTWYPFGMGSPAQMQNFINTALQEQSRLTALPFVLVQRETGTIIGSTRYGNIEPEHRRLEIGWTWITPRFQRSLANTEAKYLLLQYAFETLRLIRVEFKTDSLNVRSRTALIRIGATEEGTLRNHMITHSGRIRHSVYFSITAEEWPNVRSRLLALLAVPFRENVFAAVRESKP